MFLFLIPIDKLINMKSNAGFLSILAGAAGRFFTCVIPLSLICVFESACDA